jgi:hypothetical protein
VPTLVVTQVGTSSSTRAKLWAANGPDILLGLLAEQVRGPMQQLPGSCLSN